MSPEPRAGQVSLVLSTDLTLLGVIRGAVYLVAQQNRFAEAEAMNLTHAVEQACRILIAGHYQNRPEATLRLRLDSFADRLEVVVEDGDLGALTGSAPEAFLMARGVDRVVQEQTGEGIYQLTLIKYRRQSPAS
ncbi:MAG: hypothetical protein ACE5H2_01550 [Terriglobia bacterium]